MVVFPIPSNSAGAQRGLVIVTKLGARRGADKSWIHALSRQELIDGVHDNLRNVALDAIDLVNLRVGGITEPSEGSIEEPLTVLIELKRHRTANFRVTVLLMVKQCTPMVPSDLQQTTRAPAS
jgi:aryl-alcohol dehydrogenase-like predicted oxidoreductase